MKYLLAMEIGGDHYVAASKDFKITRFENENAAMRYIYDLVENAVKHKASEAAVVIQLAELKFRLLLAPLDRRSLDPFMERKARLVYSSVFNATMTVRLANRNILALDSDIKIYQKLLAYCVRDVAARLPMN